MKEIKEIEATLCSLYIEKPYLMFPKNYNVKSIIYIKYFRRSYPKDRYTIQTYLWIQQQKAYKNDIYTICDFCCAMLYFHKIIGTYNLNRNFYNNLNIRKLVKHMVMTDFYNSSTQTQVEKLLESFEKQNLENGIYFSKSETQNFTKLAKILVSVYKKWIKTTYPDALLLSKAIYFFCKQKRFNPGVLKSAHTWWYYNPAEPTAYSKSLFNKDYKLHKYSPSTDYKKLSTGYISNYIQYLDGILASKILQKCFDKNIPVAIIHDCFRTSIFYSKELKMVCRESYLEFFEDDYLKTHFSAIDEERMMKMRMMKMI